MDDNVEPGFAAAGSQANALRNGLTAHRRAPERARGGQLLATRDVREYSSCQRRIGIRFGTVMENSRSPLVVWFGAIRPFPAKKSITAAELALAIGIHHQATARHIIRCIRSALPTDGVCIRFAGLGS